MSMLNRKDRRRRKKSQLPVQTLFETCKDVFANGGVDFIPPPDHVHRLRSILDSLKSDDVDLSPDMPYFRETRNGRASVITYLHLYECDKFSMGIFCLPPSSVLPLHNHPGMTVFSKLLFGTMHIKSYDWVDNVSEVSALTSRASENTALAAKARLAKLNVNANFVAPCDTSILYPTTGGNMHCFTAVTACAVFDVLSPPYSDPDGRHCAYYLEHPFERFSVDGLSVAESEKEEHAWLQEREKPRDLAIVGALYRGPKIVLY
ncbi:plant cysteine oxidase 2 [Silene latifolia]|uniref:plant cysteine oxidase 2 n=1 Tax=Silene latifolia TaxID=37657 RepID=UPI003D771AD2